MTKPKFLNKIWDKFGICSSTICLIHCLATPILLMIFPASSFPFLRSHMVHEVLAVVVVTSILIAVYPTCRKHGHKDIIAFALIGVVLVLGALGLSHYVAEPIHHGVTMVGSIFLIIAHVKNMKVRHGKCSTQSSCSSEH